ncbi:MAG: bifunctional UDP-N-acetylmuramoyl-tripeptide:D-alanyl-D-alanine ligase/alanine racemase [Bacteroidales bacterium]|nr:bifunctional UDP-N-acetylmuramoyl-tripeptide:D-alanyl-D-alanine ligase/alanine racemase [Bacteroidales bacterium]
MFHRIYTGEEIKKILKSNLVSSRPESILIRDILIDSRRLISPVQTLFFALKTKRNDGHKYVGELYQKGIRNFVVTDLGALSTQYADASFFVVDDSLKALQQLTAAHRAFYDIPVIGITGSNGKTIVKEWLFQLMSGNKTIVRSPKSYNSQIGVPLSVWQMNEQHEMAIFEAGISEPDEMDALQNIIKPSVGIFTNIGEAHSENFISKAQKIGEKLKLFTRVKTLIYSSDQKELQEIIIRTGILENIESFTWGKDDTCDLRIVGKEISGKGTRVSARYDNKDLSIEIPFTDSASYENACHCWSAMLLYGYDQKIIAKEMKKLASVAMRLEQKEGINNCTIINDAYNSDFNSLAIALDFMSQQQQHKERVVILSDILQSGRSDADLYADVAQLLKQKQVTRLIGIGPIISRHADAFEMEKVFYPSTREFLSGFSLVSLRNQTILLKGARVFEFERINRLLQQKVHETVFEINLNALVSNLNYYRSILKTDTKVMAMVKAFSYGSGSFEIANVLQFHQVDYLAVAYADEGVELRRAGITLPIMVMSPEEYAFDLMIAHQLEPEIFSFRALTMLENAIERNVLPPNKPVKIHIKLNTGMHRLGFQEEDMPELIERLKKSPLIYVQSAFSHLAGSDKSELDDFTRQQIARFDTMGEELKKAADHPILLHILNSSGIVRFPEAQYDMVRLGIGMYGVASEKEAENQLQNVTSLRSEIAQIRNVKQGESVGYNRSYIAPSDRKIATVSVGYADGLCRRLGNGKFSLWVNDKKAPIVGDVCMDMCMIDITDIDAKEGDLVTVFDSAHPVKDLSVAADTIPYEILSRISRRVKRVYYHE